MSAPARRFLFFFFNDTATTEIYTLSLHDALPICAHAWARIETACQAGRRHPQHVAPALTRGRGLKHLHDSNHLSQRKVAPALTRGRGLKLQAPGHHLLADFCCARAHAWARIETRDDSGTQVLPLVAPALTRGRGLKLQQAGAVEVDRACCARAHAWARIETNLELFYFR